MMRPGVLSAVICIALALAVAGAFVGIATVIGGYTWFELSGGAAWLFLVLLLALMPLVVPAVRRRTETGASVGRHGTEQL